MFCIIKVQNIFLWKVKVPHYLNVVFRIIETYTSFSKL